MYYLFSTLTTTLKPFSYYIPIIRYISFLIHLYYIQKYEKVIVKITSLHNHTICIRLNSVIFLPIIKK